MSKFLKPLIILPALFVFFHFTPSLAEEINQNAAKEIREELQKKLDNLDSQIGALDSIIQQKRTESASLERDIAIFDAKIKKAKLEIQKLDGEIVKTKTGISQKSEQIITLSAKSEKKKDSLAELIRKNNEMDSTGLAEIILGYQKMSDFFVTEDTLEPIHRLIQDTLDEIRSTKKQTEKEKDGMVEYQAEQVQLKAAQEMERKKLAANEAEKKNLLKISKGVEEGYRAIMALKQKDAATIRSQLFLLSGSPSISFEKAVEYANLVWNKLKVRPAFLLGVIREESNLGANVGKGNWKEDLAHPNCAKQRTAFTQITSELGLDPDLLPVSKKVWYGYCGGAMGPAQFMPTTWLLYKKGISNITGNNPPNPWNPKDAFVASGLLLKDNGASVGGYAAERKAALKYLAGGNWEKPKGSNRENPSYAFYGNDVMEFAADYQEQIDIINKMASLAESRRASR